MRDLPQSHHRSKNYREVIGIVTRGLYDNDGRLFFDVLTEEKIENKIVKTPHVIQVGKGSAYAVRRIKEGDKIWIEGSHSAFGTLILRDFINFNWA